MSGCVNSDLSSQRGHTKTGSRFKVSSERPEKILSVACGDYMDFGTLQVNAQKEITSQTD